MHCWHWLRVLLVIGLIFLMWFALDKISGFFASSILRAFVSFFAAIFIYHVTSNIFDKLIGVLCCGSLKALNSMETMLVVEPEGYPYNSGFLIEFERQTFTYDKLKKWAREVFFEKLPGSKFKLTDRFGHFFWTKMSRGEFDGKFEQNVSQVNGIKTK